MSLKIPEVISEAEFNQLLKAAKKNELKAAFRFGFYQGMRVTEVISLNKEDVNIETGFIHIRQGKGCKDRQIPIRDEVIHYIRYLPINYTRQGLHKAIRTLSLKVLNKDIHFHTLRHSGATYYLNDKGVDIRFIQQFLGHTRLSTTQIYTHINPQQLKNAFDNASKVNYSK
jgi:integrase/recombinase XerD